MQKKTTLYFSAKPLLSKSLLQGILAIRASAVQRGFIVSLSNAIFPNGNPYHF
jgi:hypothetical protein